MSAIEDTQEEVKPDMTPMIDTVFLMIIFFVCIDFRVLESKLPAYLPKDKGGRPEAVEPMQQLSIVLWVENAGTPEYPVGASRGDIGPNGRPHRFVLRNHRVRWEVGPKPIYDLQEVRKELERIVAAPESVVSDLATGGKKLMPCVIEAHPGTYYEDVARTADAAHVAGFQEINFGGGLGARK